MTLETQIKVVEQGLDSAAASLKIYRWPLRYAVEACLVAAGRMVHREWETPFDSYAATAIAKDSLQLLMPRLYRHCPVDTTEVLRKGELEKDSMHALEFFRRFDHIEHAFILFHKGIYRIEPQKWSLSFYYAQPELSAYDMVHSALDRQADEGRVLDALTAGVFSNLDGPLEELRADLKGENIQNELAYIKFWTRRLMFGAHSAIVKQQPGPVLDPRTVLGQYTMEEAHRVWMGLKAYSVAWSLVVQQIAKAVPRHSGPTRTTLHTTLDELTKVVGGFGLMAPQKARTVLNDLVFDPTANRPDLKISPLCPVGNGELILTAFLVDSANFETCVCKAAAQKGSGYSQAVQVEKDNLSEKVTQEFTNHGFRSIARRKFRNSNRKEMGEIDVLLFSKDPHPILYIIEVKWVIPPDGTKESMIAFDKIEEGRNQAVRAADFIRNNPNTWGKQLLGKALSPYPQIQDVVPLVLSRGSLGDCPLTRQPYTFDLDLALDFLQSGGFEDLPEFWEAVLGAHRDSTKKWRPTRNTVDLAGYRLEAPINERRTSMTDVRMNDIFTGAFARSVGRNDECGCGSGRKYKKCCGGLL